MKEIKFIILSSFGSVTVINYGSDSDILPSYGSGSASQKVTIPTVPVPQHWRQHCHAYLSRVLFWLSGVLLRAARPLSRCCCSSAAPHRCPSPSQNSGSTAASARKKGNKYSQIFVNFCTSHVLKLTPAPFNLSILQKKIRSFCELFQF